MHRILLIKTSSLGDVVHNLPVVEDIQRALGEVVIDWAVEKSFAAIPAAPVCTGESRACHSPVPPRSSSIADRPETSSIGFASPSWYPTIRCSEPPSFSRRLPVWLTDI